jgi:hypothetical protein
VFEPTRQLRSSSGSNGMADSAKQLRIRQLRGGNAY